MAKVTLTPEISAQIAHALKSMEGKEFEEGKTVNLTPEAKAGTVKPAWYIAYSTNAMDAKVDIKLEDSRKR